MDTPCLAGGPEVRDVTRAGITNEVFVVLVNHLNIKEERPMSPANHRGREHGGGLVVKCDVV